MRVEIFISGGSEIDRYRDIAGADLRRLDQMFFHELGVPVSIATGTFGLMLPGSFRVATFPREASKWPTSHTLLSRSSAPSVPR
jgi:monoamine oxidase